MKFVFISSPPLDQKALEADLRALRAAGRRIRSSKARARRFLAATGMYTKTGKLKRQFR
jgi:hypothetical protein